MKALTKGASWLRRRVRLVTLQPPEPEPVYAERRPVVGLFNSLTPEQKKKALAFRGPEALGDDAFRLKKASA
jgi:hypothetical protein